MLDKISHRTALILFTVSGLIFLLVSGFVMLLAFDILSPEAIMMRMQENDLIQKAVRRTNIPVAEPYVMTDWSIRDDFVVTVDVNREAHAISNLIYGVSFAEQDFLLDTGATMNNWGGNATTRYNWEIGNAWNAARDWQFRNGDYDEVGNVADAFLSDSAEIGRATRLALPTLGWVAKDTNNDTCSFPQPDGSCSYVYESNCDNPTVVADPTTANIQTDVEFMRRWLQYIKATHGSNAITILAMDNEPELWGYTHYDVHPDCTTYDEVLDQYIRYATMARQELPDAQLAGPTTCCWHYYWNSPAGRSDKRAHGGQDFLPWFLDQMREYDEAAGERHLDILDLHYYPTEGIYSYDISDRVADMRLRSTRSLWDRDYRDESWINQPIYLIPRMKELIDAHYPGTKFALSEWNFGADSSMNGALAIADALGVFGREDLYFATYWTTPNVGSPGYLAFKLYRNYDDNGGKFGDLSVVSTSSDDYAISSFASIDTATGNLHVMLVNKQEQGDTTLTLDLQEFEHNGTAKYVRLDAENPESFQAGEVVTDSADFSLTLPAYSITHVIISAD
ncbi:MAG: glycoside hydrolase family 44 protein [Candidatus Promineifilaceae bacterium]